MPTTVDGHGVDGSGAESEPTTRLLAAPDTGDHEQTVAFRRKARADEDDDHETAVMAGRDILAFRLKNRGAPSQPAALAPVPRPAPSQPAAPVFVVPAHVATQRLPEPDPEDLPTQAVPSRRWPEVADVTAATRVQPLVFGAPPPSVPSAWDTAPTLPRTPPVPPGPPSLRDAARDTLAEWNPARRHSAQTLWMTAIAGLVLMLVLFAGISLLR
jgi:hypothetical protein